MKKKAKIASISQSFVAQTIGHDPRYKGPFIFLGLDVDSLPASDLALIVKYFAYREKDRVEEGLKHSAFRR